MASSAEPTPQMTLDEYLAFEETSPVRHEFVAGQVFAMTGGTIRHNLIALNVAASLRSAARAGSCRVLVNDVKVLVDDRTIYYPDVLVTCAPVDGRAVLVHEPCLVFEVTSPSTRTTDLREKLGGYQRIPSLRAYLVVEQDRRSVERHWSDEDGRWWHATVNPQRTNGRIPVPCLETELTLDEIYDGIELDAPDEGDEAPLRRVREPSAQS